MQVVEVHAEDLLKIFKERVSFRITLLLYMCLAYAPNLRLRGHIINYGRGDRHVRQNSPAIFGDPPHLIGMEIGDPPHTVPYRSLQPHYSVTYDR